MLNGTSVSHSNMRVSGLFYIPDLDINGQEIIDELDKKEWKPITKSVQSRKIQHYGFTFDYASGKVGTACDDIPPCLTGLRRMLAEFCTSTGMDDEKYEPNQCIVNDYQPGQGISRHVDAAGYGPIIGCFTLGSAAAMTFRREDLVEDVYVKAESLYVMTGDARYKWTHEMASRMSDKVHGERLKRGRRVSVTFRSVM
jgi:alkylated DNA repair protein alkB family protein 8